MTSFAATAAGPLVDIRALTKSYGTHRVLQGIDLQIARGAITAIIGPNGAGKTTLNKALLGLVHADGGSIRFDGTDTAGTVDHRARIGYMPQAAQFPETFSGRDVLDLLGDLRGDERPRDEELVEQLELATFLQQPVRALSGGQRQRLNAAAAFLFSPDLLLLDEPTAGLDPVASGVLKDKIRRLRDEGRAVVITSHVLSELEELADVVVFLLDGRVHWAGSLSDLLASTHTDNLERAIASLMLAQRPTTRSGHPASAHGALA
jgi:Cu-processing system ATP-binding protein